jgi:hypothetical protein
MNKNTRNMLFLLSIIILAITSQVLLTSTNNKESFVPMLNRVYRPYIRKMRNYSTNKLEYFKSKITNTFKKNGIV